MCAAALALVALIAPGAARAQATAVVVEGARRIDPATVRAYFRPGPNGRLDEAAVDAGVKAIWASGLFTDVKVTRAGNRLIVAVAEAPVIDRVQIEGNRRLKDTQILSELQSKPMAGLARAKVQADAARIAGLYRAAGRLGVRVEPKTIERSAGRVDLVFEIVEGDRTPVRKVTFVGNRGESERALRAAIRTREAGLVSLIAGGDAYDPDLIGVDSEHLRRHYLHRGYADMRVVSAGGRYDPALRGFVVAYVIEEGERYRFGRVDLVSRVPGVERALLAAASPPRPGEVYDADAVEKTTERLTVALSKAGRPFTSVNARVERRSEAHAVDLVFLVEEGPRAYIERIEVRGNTRTRDDVVRREFDIAEGDPLNRALLDRAERRLKQLGYFKTVKITTAPGSAPDRVVVEVALDDQPTGEFNVAGGYSTVDGFIGEVSLGDKNVLGRGQQARAAMTLGQYTKAFNLLYVEPYAFGTRVSLGGELFGKQSLTNANQSYGSTLYGATVQAGMPLADNLTQQVRYSLSNQSISLVPALRDCSPANPPPGCYANGEASAATKAAAAAGPAWVSLVGASSIYNTLDNNRSPKNGLRAQFNNDVAGLGGDAKFMRATQDVRYYREVSEGVVGLVREQSGFVTPWGGQPIPFQNSFFGGPQFVRGFAPNGFGPRDLTPGTKNDNIGGSRYWTAAAELQSELPFVPSAMGLRGAVFADAGSLWGYRGSPATAQAMTVGDGAKIRSSIGAGLIWDSPLGALRVDYAFPTSKTSYDVTQRLRFGAGPF